MVGTAELMWVRAPAAVHRLSRTLGLILADGAYLRAWPPVAVILPIAAGLLGAFLGGIYGVITGEALFAASFLVVALMAVPAGFGAGVGLAAWIGFVAADLVFTDRGSLPGFDPYRASGFAAHAGRGYVPLAMAYLLLFGLLVITPLAARAFALRAEAVAGRRQKDLAVPAGGGVSILVTAGLAYAWAQAVPVMIRPLWTFSGDVPDAEALRPMQTHPVLLAVLMGVAAAGRLVLSALASAQPDGRPVPIEPRPHRPWAVAALRTAGPPIQALVITLLLAGLVTGLLRGVLFGLFVLGILAIRVIVIPMIPGYARVVRRTPLLLRMVVCALAAYALAMFVVEPWMAHSDRSLTMIVAVVVPLVVAIFVLPGPLVWVRTKPVGPTPPADLGPADRFGSADFGGSADLGGPAGLGGSPDPGGPADPFGPADPGDFGDFGDLGGPAGRRDSGRHKAREPRKPAEPSNAPTPSQAPEPSKAPTPKAREPREVLEPREPVGSAEPADRWKPSSASEAPEPTARAPEPTARAPKPSRKSKPSPAPESGRETEKPAEPSEPRDSRKSRRRGKPEDDDLEGWPGLLRRSVAATAGGLVLATASPAYAESCFRLADDCTLTGKVAPTAAGITLVLLTIIMLPEILAGVAEAPRAAVAGDEEWPSMVG